jgi:PPP family 3-phenylpropionic acid transporter
VEVAVLSRLHRLVAQLGLKRLLVLAYGCGLARWTLTAWLPAGPAIIAVQALHGVTFGCFFGASVVWMSRSAPPGLAASSQSAFAAVVFGGAGIVAQIVSGFVFRNLGGRALFALAAILEIIPLVAIGAMEEPPDPSRPDL